MDHYLLDFYGLKRHLPIVRIAPKLKIASFSLLGDVEITAKAAEVIANKIKDISFDLLVGPEVKIVPLLYALSLCLNKPRFVVCRKSVKGYMVNPLILKTQTKKKPEFIVIDGQDAALIKGKNCLIVDDVVSSGRTIENLKKIITQAGGRVVKTVTIFKQNPNLSDDIMSVMDLPVFPSV